MSVSFLKHYYSFSITFNVLLRSISGTDKVDSVIIFNILEWTGVRRCNSFWIGLRAVFKLSKHMNTRPLIPPLYTVPLYSTSPSPISVPNEPMSTHQRPAYQLRIIRYHHYHHYRFNSIILFILWQICVREMKPVFVGKILTVLNSLRYKLHVNCQYTQKCWNFCFDISFKPINLRSPTAFVVSVIT